MKKSSKSSRRSNSDQPNLFETSRSRFRRSLILPVPLAEEAENVRLRGEKQDRASAVIEEWIPLQDKRHLREKETALDASFLFEIFGKALGYTTTTQTPQRYHLERNFTVPGVGTADGAIGIFEPGCDPIPIAVIELKGMDTDLDFDRFNGRTPVQQCWDYLNALPDCPWGIVSNFVSIRLYHRNKTPLAYEEFHLHELSRTSRFREFFYLFERDGLLTSNLGQPPRALSLLEKSDAQRLEVGDRLYAVYSQHRLRLIRHLQTVQRKSKDAAIRIAQKLLDRIIFIAFCEQRGLLPDKSLEKAYETLPPFSKVTNPRWRNFIDLFQAIDTGHKSLDLKNGYNGGLFRHDPEVDDLQLEDDWTDFFHDISGYDFRDEVNVEVLGHLFEKSIGELQRIREGGLIREEDSEPDSELRPTAMIKSAERKRLGTYYTPPDFTRFLVRQTVSTLIEQRREAIRITEGLSTSDLVADKAMPALASYWRKCWDDLRSLKICDPACGSGAFLIQAYDVLEEDYVRVADLLRLHEGPQAEALLAIIPDLILNENLHGVDLSEQAVEITQLALWIRSARRGRTLSDLSQNIVYGNSLVHDPLVHDKAIDWPRRFPAVFDRAERGFDCVVGNPPWERLKLQEREFFASSAPEIAGAVSAADRRSMILALENADPELFAAYTEAKRLASLMIDYARTSGQYPLTGQGDINTYVLFAELARSIVAQHGRVGLLLPSGISTDNTTKEFFGAITGSKQLISIYDFENKEPIFPDVHRSFKFCTFVFGGEQAEQITADFVFFAHRMEDLNERQRHIALSAKDLALLNPNSHTCPIFRSRRDAELTKALYRRVPILIDDSREEGGNPWGIKYVTMFHQTNDAELFSYPEGLEKLGLRHQGNRWLGKGRTFLPLYEAKMIRSYDHRAASVVIAEGNWVRQGQTEKTSLVQHQNPEFVAQPRWWVEDKQVDRILNTKQSYCIAYKDVTSSTNERTVIAAFIPRVGIVNSAPLMLTDKDLSPRRICCLLSNLNALGLDYVARQKVGGLHLNYFIVNQLPVFPPDHYALRCPWDRRQTLEKWISERVLKLTCTANDMVPLAEAAGFTPTIHKWVPTERAELVAELDAAYFLLYGLTRDEVEFVLSTFSRFKAERPSNLVGISAPSLLLKAYDRLSASSNQP